MSQQPPSDQNQPLFNQYPQQGQLPPQGYPQYPQQPPLMQPAPTLPKKKRGKGLIIGAIVLVVALALCGVIGSALSHSVAATTSTTSTKVGSTSDATPTTIPTQATSYKVGDVVNVGNAWDVTLVSAKANQGNDVFQPKSGMQYLIISLAMKNLTTENHSISSIIQFTLRNDDGTKYNVALYAPDGTSQIDGDVDGGQPAKGVISYEVPTNVHGFRLTFESVISSGRATWNLTI